MVSRLTSTKKARFINALDNWYVKYEEFINKKVLIPQQVKNTTHGKNC